MQNCKALHSLVGSEILVLRRNLIVSELKPTRMMYSLAQNPWRFQNLIPSSTSFASPTSLPTQPMVALTPQLIQFDLRHFVFL